MLPKLSHFHSAFFLLSRAALVSFPFLSWHRITRWISAALLVATAHSVALYVRRRHFVDERNIYLRPDMRHIQQSNGPVGKILAAVEVHVWNLSQSRHLVNLIHWLEKALRAAVLVEIYKIETSLQFKLVFRWCPKSFAVLVYPLRYPGDTLITVQIWEAAWTRVRSKLPPRWMSHPKSQALNSAPSFTVWAWWLLKGRVGLHCLQDDPRERSFHMASLATHKARLEKKREGGFVRPEAFGYDMTEEFSLGISRRIHVDEVENVERLTEMIQNDVGTFLRPPLEEIDHEATFCISYRHLLEKEKEAQGVSLGLLLAARLTKTMQKSHFHVWLDRLLRLSTGRVPQRWAFYGLLPYAYYPVIAVRGMEEDEQDRMWLLAEERMAYGNIGLHRFDMKDGSVEFISGVNQGPANSMRIYLRYLKTGEAAKELTYHEEDRKRFIMLADAHGVKDDEHGMYMSLSGQKKIEKKNAVTEVWWPLVFDVESYAPLRRATVHIDEINFERRAGVPFDGYREWFKFLDVRLNQGEIDTRNNARSNPDALETRTLQEYIARFATPRFQTYSLWSEAENFVLLLLRESTGTIFRTVCILISVSIHPNGFIPVVVYRVQFKYEVAPDFELVVQVLTNRLSSVLNVTVSNAPLPREKVQFIDGKSS